jgi:hypothetical protein
MRILKLLSFVLVGAFLVAFGYANVRHLSPTEKLKQVHLASFTMNGDLSSAERASLEKKVSTMEGVRACSINSNATTASVTFFPDLINEKDLAAALSNDNQLTIAQKEFATTGGCPVHAVSASLSQFVSVLDLR